MRGESRAGLRIDVEDLRGAGLLQNLYLVTRYLAPLKLSAPSEDINVVFDASDEALNEQIVAEERQVHISHPTE